MKSVSRTMYEVDGLPEEAVARCNVFDEVWVPSSHNRAVFAGAGVSEQAEVPAAAGHDGGGVGGGRGGGGQLGQGGRRRGSRLRAVPEGFDPAVFFCGPRQPACAGELPPPPPPTLLVEPPPPPPPLASGPPEPPDSSAPRGVAAVIDWLAEAEQAAEEAEVAAKLSAEGNAGTEEGCGNNGDEAEMAAAEEEQDEQEVPPWLRPGWGPAAETGTGRSAAAEDGEDGQLPPLMQAFLGFDGQGRRPAREEAAAVAARGGAAAQPQPLVFLSVFKWEERKGWRQLLAAFWG